MNVTLQDALTATNDHIGSYSTGIASNDVKIRHIDRAYGYIKRNLSIPGDETKQTIWFSSDEKFYDLNADVDETLLLRYADDALNISGNEFEYASYPEILKRTGGARKNRYSITSVNGAKQLVISAYNQWGGTVIDEISAVGNWTDEADASGLALDTDRSYDTNGSLAFDVTNSTGTAAIQDASITLDIDTLRAKHGFVKLRTWLPSANIDAMALKLYTDDSNYYTITATETDSGEDFTADEWLKIAFAMDDAIATGTPTDTDINKIRIEWDLGAGFTTGVDFRIDTIFTTIPDELELTYYSAYKGTTAAGVALQTLTSLDDILSISDHGEDLVDVIAQRAAITLWPQLRGDLEAYTLLARDFKENMKSFARRWPRKRVQNNSLRTRLVR